MFILNLSQLLNLLILSLWIKHEIFITLYYNYHDINNKYIVKKFSVMIRQWPDHLS